MNTTQVIQVINVTLSDYLFLCYWECKWALLEPFIVKDVRNRFITLNGKWNCIVISRNLPVFYIDFLQIPVFYINFSQIPVFYTHCDK